MGDFNPFSEMYSNYIAMLATILNVHYSLVRMYNIITIEVLISTSYFCLGTIGGWLSLCCGFSLVSLAELMFFLGWLTLKIMFKRKMEKKHTPDYILKGGKVPI